ncbi:hypothetical protein BDZ94DRAFT_1322969 [Collybia nuda]|uniref:F-box domain-containing protein n=1 Tax=Collybia nuda TaxID=64659 RepID=A0A9P5Y3A5_9AGAR|nr:hypothetical protein BDZ94DRAFT_1322969 [Collybia nuda]
MAQYSRPALQTLPLEILNQIAFELVALQPLGPPCDIIPLLLTSSHFNQALSPSTNPVLFARIFRYKFDTRAVERRAFTPSHVQCMEQLVHYCRTMQVLRSGDVYVEPRPMYGGDDDERSATDALFTAFMMMLEDDGKNARQLQEWACADAFAERYLRRRLFEDREENDGWPIESAPNSCALWLMWMLTTEDKLRNETDAQREQMIQLLLPFVFISLRYASSEAPPHFFTLPFPSSTHPNLPQSITSAHGPYPVYPSAQRDFSQIHYATRPVFSPPLAAPAAKLLYFSRRELRPLPIPPHFAQNRAELHARGNFEIGPTVEDMHELNWSWTARLPTEKPTDAPDSCEEWGSLVPPPITRAESAASEELGVFGGSQDPKSRWYGKAPPVERKGGKSRSWDADWWRLRLCGNPLRANPSVRYGRVYEPGCMDGLWVGRMLVSSENVTRALMTNTEHPGPGTLNDMPPYTMQAPIYMRLHEAHGVAGELAAALPSARDLSALQTSTSTSADDGISNAWFAGRTGHVQVSDIGDAGAGTGKRVLVEAEGGRAGKGVYRRWDPRGNMWEGYAHDAEVCDGCAAREEVDVKNRLADALEREELFRSVGLGVGGCQEGEEEGEEEGYYEEEGSEDGGEQTEEEVVDPEWDPVENMDEPGLRAHNRRKVLPCDGIKDIVLFGATDERHGQAFNHFTYYGRVRPWDGLVGILSKARDDSYGYLFFYGYLVGGKNFVGNWRITSEDANGPVWESAFAMSRRDDV